MVEQSVQERTPVVDGFSQRMEQKPLLASVLE